MLLHVFLFNNKFIKSIRIWSIFQKHQKINVFILISKITNLYVRSILDIKRKKNAKICLDSRMTRFDP